MAAYYSEGEGKEHTVLIFHANIKYDTFWSKKKPVWHVDPALFTLIPLNKANLFQKSDNKFYPNDL